MSRRLMLRNASGGGGLPSEYQQVEWIQNGNNTLSATNNFLVTDVLANPVTKADFVLMKLRDPTSGPMIISSGKAAPFGALDNQQSAYVCTPEINPSSRVNELLDVSFTKTVSGSGYVTLFSWANGAWICGIKCYSAKIWHGDTLVFDGIPCYRKSDGQVGLFNSITRVFCAGTSIYTKGADVN